MPQTLPSRRGTALALATTLALSLSTLGCDGDASDPAASEVAYEPAAGLTATTVQAALDALAEEVQAAAVAAQTGASERAALGGRVDALEQAGGDPLAPRVSALEAAVDGLAPRVEALEQAGPPPAADVTVAPVAGLEGGDVQAALAALHGRLEALDASHTALQASHDALQANHDAAEAQIEALQTTVDAQEATIAGLEDQLASLGACPEGMVAIVGACVDAAPRGPYTVSTAMSQCKNDGLRLCTFEEAVQACQKDALSFVDIEWVGEWFEPDVPMAVDFDSACSPGQQTTVSHNSSQPFRCCKTRVEPSAL